MGSKLSHRNAVTMRCPPGVAPKARSGAHRSASIKPGPSAADMTQPGDWEAANMPASILELIAERLSLTQK